MTVYYITFRNVTPAQRGEGILKKYGISCRLTRTPRWMEEQGCGYCLKMGPERILEGVTLLRENQINFRKIYSQQGNGEAQEVVL